MSFLCLALFVFSSLSLFPFEYFVCFFLFCLCSFISISSLYHQVTREGERWSLTMWETKEKSSPAKCACISNLNYHFVRRNASTGLDVFNHSKSTPSEWTAWRMQVLVKWTLHSALQHMVSTTCGCNQTNFQLQMDLFWKLILSFNWTYINSFTEHCLKCYSSNRYHHWFVSTYPNFIGF